MSAAHRSDAELANALGRCALTHVMRCKVKKRFIYIFLVAFMLVGVVVCDVSSVWAETISQDYSVGRISSGSIKVQGSINSNSSGYIRGACNLQLCDLTTLDISKFDSTKDIKVMISFDLVHNRGSSSALTYLNSDETLLYIQLGNTKYEQLISSGSYSYEFPWYDGELKINGTLVHYVSTSSSITSTKYWYDKVVVENLVVTLSQEVEDEEPTETESETPSEIPSEMPSETENETPSETPSDTENDDGGGSSGGGSSENLTVNETAIYNALTAYFENNTVQVVSTVDAPGINKPLDELSLTEICLVIIVLILLGRSILKIVGGRAWSR